MLSGRRAVQWTLCAVGVLAVAEAAVRSGFDPKQSWLRTDRLFFRAEAMLGYAVGVYFASRMAGEYRPSSGMKKAWFWITAAASAFCVCQALEIFFRSLPRLQAEARLIGLTVSLTLMLPGFSKMRRAIRAAGLSPEMKRIDWCVSGVVTVLAAGDAILGVGAWHAQASLFFRSIREIGPLLVGAGVIAVFLLYRSTVAFGGGQFSRAIRGLILFFAMQLLLYRLGFDLTWLRMPLANAVTHAIYDVLPWLLAVALASCWNVPLTAAAIAARYASEKKARKLSFPPRPLTPRP